MARNGSGTYSIPNTLVAGTTVTAAPHNQNYSDIGAELTNSVAKDGQTTMTGPLKAATGTVAAPSITFGSDTNTGLFRKDSDTIGVSAGGSEIAEISSSGIDVTGAVTATSVDATTVKQGGVSLIPPGVMVDYAGSTAPNGWLICDGSAVSRTTYADLFDVIGTDYGDGDSSTTFNLPDAGGRVTAGKEATATRLTTAGSGIDGGTLGATGGVQKKTLAKENLPDFGVTITDSGHSHTVSSPNQALTGGGPGALASGAAFAFGSLSVNSATTGITAAFGSTARGGSQTDLAIAQPTLIVNKIIKT